MINPEAKPGDRLRALLREREPQLTDLMRERYYPTASRRQVRVAHHVQTRGQ